MSLNKCNKRKKKKNGKQKNRMKLISKEKRKELRAFEKMAATDLRGYNNDSHSMFGNLQLSALPIQTGSSVNYFIGVTSAIASYAIQRGWTEQAFEDDYVYWAIIYQAKLLEQIAKGATPLAASVPRWMNLLGQAIIKTEVSCGNGTIAYVMTLPDTLTLDYLVEMGPQVFGHRTNYGVKTGALVNGYYSIITSPGLYTDENGQIATQSLWQFLEADHVGSRMGPMHKMEPVNKKNCMTGDASAFGFFVNNPGGGYRDTGAWRKNIFSEQLIRTPLFSTFIPSSPDQSLDNRGQVFERTFTGDTVFLGGMLAGTLEEKQIHMKRAPIISFVDMNEFFDVFARAITLVGQIRANEADFVTNNAVNPNYFEEYIRYPLTIQDLRILLRASMMPLFENYKCQGMFPRSVSGIENGFVAYNCGVGTAPIPLSETPLWPRAFTESIKALKERWINVNGKEADPLFAIPVLGEYNRDAEEITADLYQVSYEIGGVSTIQLMFPLPGGEDFISMVSGYTGSEYVTINDPSAINQLAEIHNKWMRENSNYWVRPTPMSNDLGIGVFANVGVTTHWLQEGQTPSFKKKKDYDRLKEISAKLQHEYDERKRHRMEEIAKSQLKRGGDDKVEIRVDFNARYDVHKKKIVKEKGLVPNNLYNERQLIALTSNAKWFDAAFTQLQQYFPTPVNNIASGSNSPTDNTGYYKMASLQHQPIQRNTGTGSFNFTSIGERSQNFASMLVRQRLADEPAYVRVFDHFDERGEGGILGTIGRAFAGPVGAVATGALMGGISGGLGALTQQ
mmetsp:Transcript_45109/g.40390  ORF Transcript_45109/g.40390 Transcript_45109/m.40390 type:complete len:791 (+) Transcript_45109:53-2425(+)|eukprot:CAMPEP_0201587136 /NCGR_PEP_ID=MMETSP0190_2-20130828/140490_1 /ASSEMBLY_ACC=CAM_ASM_000263 /TAXON_ID=37353 /ORGANISM="Rosalina sp." /LENGTH=790 /DNA_ID=CAMNT_0048036551 /DNA_START=46 /DNA_END=2418 /DNA_ORIENTATION=+